MSCSEVDPISEEMLARLEDAGASDAVLTECRKRLEAGFKQYGPWDPGSRDWLAEQIEEAVDGLHYAMMGRRESRARLWWALLEVLLEDRDTRLPEPTRSDAG